MRMVFHTGNTASGDQVRHVQRFRIFVKFVGYIGAVANNCPLLRVRVRFPHTVSKPLAKVLPGLICQAPILGDKQRAHHRCHVNAGVTRVGGELPVLPVITDKGVQRFDG